MIAEEISIEPERIHNIVQRVLKHGLTTPHKTALIFEDGQSLSFLELLNKIQQLRDELKNKGLHKGDHVLVFLPISKEFIFLIFALFAENIIPVLIDPRLNKSYWKKYVAQVKTKAIISNHRILNLRWFWWWFWKYKLISVDQAGLGCQKLSFDSVNLVAGHTANIPPNKTTIHTTNTDQLQFQDLVYTDDHEEVLLTLTSGTTGEPKIVPRNLFVLKNQQKLSCEHLPDLTHDVHLPLYGIALLQSIVHGSTTLLAINHDPTHLLALIQKNNITRLSGPPGTLDKILYILEKQNQQLMSVENILTGGAPIPRWLGRKLLQAFPKASVYIVYGSTECEPISKKRISKENLQIRDFGYNVGKPIKEITLLKKTFAQYFGHAVFEVELQGPNCVTLNSDQILKTGDLAYENKFGELILVGRRNDNLQIPFLGYLEEQLEDLNGVRRIACKLKSETDLTIYVEPHSFELADTKLPELIKKTIQDSNYDLGRVQIYIQLVKKMPVDDRHAWKIQRHLL